MENTHLIPFEGKDIRRTEHDGETWFSIVDIMGVLTDSPKPSQYWNVMKTREPQIYTNCIKLKLKGIDGKMYATDCANTEGVLRIIQSVPSPKAEPFKMWLAGLGKQAIEEAQNPELLTERQAELYRAKGYPEEWITRRLKSIDIRKELTDEWKVRGVKEGQEYGILTATIAKQTFGLTPSEHSKIKGLDGQNLRDHMTNIELVLTALSEETTRAITVERDAQGFNENHEAAEKGGAVGKVARENFEKATGLKVVSPTNYLELGKKDADEQTALPTSDIKHNDR